MGRRQLLSQPMLVCAALQLWRRPSLQLGAVVSVGGVSAPALAVGGLSGLRLAHGGGITMALDRIVLELVGRIRVVPKLTVHHLIPAPE